VNPSFKMVHPTLISILNRVIHYLRQPGPFCTSGNPMFREIALKLGWHYIEPNTSPNLQHPVVLVIGFVSWDQSELDLLNRLSRARFKFQVAIFNFDEITSLEDLQLALPKSPLVSRTPAIGLYRNGGLAWWAQGVDALDFVYDRLKGN